MPLVPMIVGRYAPEIGSSLIALSNPVERDPAPAGIRLPEGMVNVVQPDRRPRVLRGAPLAAGRRRAMHPSDAWPIPGGRALPLERRFEATIEWSPENGVLRMES